MEASQNKTKTQKPNLKIAKRELDLNYKPLDYNNCQ